MNWFNIARAATITGLTGYLSAMAAAATGLITGSDNTAGIAGTVALAAVLILGFGALVMVEQLNHSYKRATAMTLSELEYAGLEHDDQGVLLTPPRCADCGENIDRYTGRFSTDRRTVTWLTQTNEPCGHEAFRHALAGPFIPQQGAAETDD